MEGIEYHDKTAIPEKIKQIVVTRDVQRYYASIQYETEEGAPKGIGVTGIDMGLMAFLTTSDGLQIFPMNSLRKVEKKLKKEQRRLSGKRKGSENRKKQIIKVKKIQQKIRYAF